MNHCKAWLWKSWPQLDLKVKLKLGHNSKAPIAFPHPNSGRWGSAEGMKRNHLCKQYLVNHLLHHVHDSWLSFVFKDTFTVCTKVWITLMLKIEWNTRSIRIEITPNPLDDLSLLLYTIHKQFYIDQLHTYLIILKQSPSKVTITAINEKELHWDGGKRKREA